MAEGVVGTPYFLGIDIGTTTVKACVLDGAGNCVGSTFLSYPDTVANFRLPKGHSEQRTQTILETVEKCMLSLSIDLRQKVTHIGVCGQMHGVVLWKHVRRPELMPCSSLVTWMDQRCRRAFLDSLPRADSHLTLNSGYGCATLFWLNLFEESQLLADYDSAGTIMDFLVASLCDLSQPVMSPQNAASWGYFNCSENTFNIAILEKAAFPVRFLPKVVPAGTIVGKVQTSWCGIKTGTDVAVALGDFQCSVYSAITSSTAEGRKGFVNISTSAQIAYVVESIAPSTQNGVEYFPFFDNTYIAVGASLNGGNVLATFATAIQNLLRRFGAIVSTDTVWERLLEEGNVVAETSLVVTPLLYGERQCEDRAEIRNLSVTNLSMGDIVRATCRGLIANLADFVSPQDFAAAGINSLVTTGSGILRNSILQQELTKKFDLCNVTFEKDSGAEFGAAKLLCNNSRKF